MWVALPDFVFDTPEPLLIDSYINDSVKSLRNAGWEGDELYIASHSLGTVMVQDYLQKNPALFKG